MFSVEIASHVLHFPRPIIDADGDHELALSLFTSEISSSYVPLKSRCVILRRVDETAPELATLSYGVKGVRLELEGVVCIVHLRRTHKRELLL